MTPAPRKKIYLEAARMIAEGEQFAVCDALLFLGFGEIYRFKEITFFEPEGHGPFWWGHCFDKSDLYVSEPNQSARVLALLLSAAMCEEGIK